MKTKKILLVVFASLFATIAIAKDGKVNKTLANTVTVKEGELYASATEVSNVQYREFLSALLKAGKQTEYENNLPDTNVWKSKLSYNEPYVQYYFRHPAYSDYPVVGVSYENALNYCAWLADSLNANLKRTGSAIKKVVVRLPTKEEWELAARGGLDEKVIYPWGTDGVIGTEKKQKDKHLANYTSGKPMENIAGSLTDKTEVTAPVSSYWSNGFGIYNMSGNVAEMLMEKGKAKGGSWTSSANEIRIDSVEQFDKPSNDIGFRYFVEVVEN